MSIKPESSRSILSFWSTKYIVDSLAKRYRDSGDVIEVLHALETIIRESSERNDIDVKWLIDALRKKYASQALKSKKKRVIGSIHLMLVEGGASANQTNIFLKKLTKTSEKYIRDCYTEMKVLSKEQGYTLAYEYKNMIDFLSGKKLPEVEKRHQSMMYGALRKMVDELKSDKISISALKHLDPKRRDYAILPE